MRKIIISIVAVPVFVLGMAVLAGATDIPAQEQAGGIEARRQSFENDLKLKRAVQQKEGESQPESPFAVEAPKPPEGPMVKVDRIAVEGCTLVSAADLAKVLVGYEGRDLSMAQMQEVVNKITEIYRNKGFITSRAVLPPQRVEGGVLKINIVEGRTGKINVQGNRFFRSSLIRAEAGLKEGAIFDYNFLKKALARVNEHPDRRIKSVLTPGADAGTTDVLLNVEDSLPIHLALTYDNYLSRYLNRNRYQGTLTHNNLLGFDDIMSLTYQLGEGHNTYRLTSMNYQFPVGNDTQLGVSVSDSQTRLGREYKDSVARGKAKIYSVYLAHTLYKDGAMDLSMNAAFDYKDIFNFVNYAETSRDRLRVARFSLKWDNADEMGRTIVNNEVAQGFPGLWGGLETHDTNGSGVFNTPNPTRDGSGGKFTKNTIDIIRLQRMIWGSNLLLKAQAQIASRILTSTEQYQLGGINNVRGFVPGEAVGDSGQTLTAEYSGSFFFVPPQMRAPFSKGLLHDALRWAVFYDMGHVTLRRPATGEARSRTLESVGAGLRYDTPEDLSLRLDVATPVKGESSDRKNVQVWMKASKSF